MLAQAEWFCCVLDRGQEQSAGDGLELKKRETRKSRRRRVGIDLAQKGSYCSPVLEPKATGLLHDSKEMNCYEGMMQTLTICTITEPGLEKPALVCSAHMRSQRQPVDSWVLVML